MFRWGEEGRMKMERLIRESFWGEGVVSAFECWKKQDCEWRFCDEGEMEWLDWRELEWEMTEIRSSPSREGGEVLKILICCNGTQK
jgi:hypothetical protein